MNMNVEAKVWRLGWALAVFVLSSALPLSAAPIAEGLTEKELEQRATSEGRLLWYAIPLPFNDLVAAEFQKKYPKIQLEILKAGGTQLIQKFELERERGAASADAVSSGLTEAFPDLRRKNYLVNLTKLPNWEKRWVS